MGATCRACRFFEALEPGDGECRRRAPLPRVDDPFESKTLPRANWPIIEDNEWCGEFQSRARKGAKGADRG